jgi:hypothetical protein
MTSFNRSTGRRLKKLTQIPSIWEGDRRPLSSSSSINPYPGSEKGDCILWVDVSQGIVRSMDVVAKEAGPEAIVRTLMRAIEHPHSPAKAARPQRIVVRDREIQFYLRGVLQDLNISIDYAPELPFIDELFRGFAEVIDSEVPDLPPQYYKALQDQAMAIWQASPWELLEEHQILSIEINKWDIGIVYASVMGMLGMEYGVLLYRSEESLKRFRAAVLKDDETQEHLEEAFLKQDCLFLTFEEDDEEEEYNPFVNMGQMSESEITPSFGNIHPLEGLRSVLYDEEALVVYVALEALRRFLHDHRRQLAKDDFSSYSRNYQIKPPASEEPESPEDLEEESQIVNVTVSTMPTLAEELEEMAFDSDDEELDEDDSLEQSLRDDLIPEDSYLSLGVVSWEMLATMRQTVNCQEIGVSGIKQVGDGLPVILVQTSRPKAKAIIDNLEQAGGLKGICFNPGADPLGYQRYDLGLLQTENRELFLFGEFDDEDPIHIEARKKWNQRCKNTKGYCGLIIAKGLTGASRGNPQLRDMMALFEARSLSAKDLGIGTLQLSPQV